MKLFGTMEVKENTLYIGGVSTEDLRKQYGTPLYVMDEVPIETQMQTFTTHFSSNTFESRVLYASKAFLNLYIAGLAKKNNLFIDVVSGGELFTVLQAGFNPKKIYFHGNNKTYEELNFAIDENVGTIILDNQYEYEMLNGLLNEKDKTQRVMVRVNPDIDTDTHKYIQTTKEDSKFGFNIYKDETMTFIKTLEADDRIDFAGIHCHIGSQIFDDASFYLEAKKMAEYAKQLNDVLGREVEEINLGGGFGVYYTAGDTPLDLTEFLPKYTAHIESVFQEYGISPKIVSIEPGRSMVNDFGSTLYTVGAIKKTAEYLTFLLVDGGMNDNMRPAMYEAKYEAYLANKMNEAPSTHYKVAGKLCETGDVLIEDVQLPEAAPGDLLIIPSTGAYAYSMSSNYNRMTRPAVVFVKDGETKVAVRRETYEDLIRNDEVME